MSARLLRVDGCRHRSRKAQEVADMYRSLAELAREGIGVLAES
jgi:hypothetical protein